MGLKVLPNIMMMQQDLNNQFILLDSFLIHDYLLAVNITDSATPVFLFQCHVVPS
jgi:hypothetical protein